MLSIVTPTLNNISGLKKTFDSIKKIQNQFVNEWIIVDSFSKDGTYKFIENIKLSNEKFFKIVYENIPPSGPYSAMNIGIDISSSKYIWIINAGDFVVNFNGYSFIKNTSKIDLEHLPIIYGCVERYSINKKYIIGSQSFADSIKFRLNEIHPSLIVPKVFYKKFGKFNINYKLAADLDLLLRFKQNQCKFIFMKEICVNFEYGGLSSQRSETFKNFLEILFYNKIGFRSFLYIFTRYIYSKLRLYFKK